MHVLRQVWPIVWKDCLTEFRTRETLLSMCFFAFLVLILFHFAFGAAGGPRSAAVLAGMLWVAFLLAGLLGLNQTFSAERYHGALEGLLLCPVNRSTIYLGKLISNFLLMSMMEGVILGLFAILFRINLRPLLLPLLLIIILGTGGFACVGTMFAAMSLNARARDMLLPVMLFPIVMPLMIAAVKSTESLFKGMTLADVGGWLRILIAFDLVFGLLAYVTFDVVMEE